MKKILLKISLLILLMVIGIFVFLTLKKEKSPSSGPASLKWQEVLPNAPWSGRDAHSTIVFKDKIWLMGGMADNKDYWLWKNDVWAATF